MMNRLAKNKILVSALAADIALEQRENLVAALAKQSEALAIAQMFSSPKLIRELRLCKKPDADESWLTVEQDDTNQILYQGQPIGKILILYKSPLPGELQARLAIESAIDRFLEYLQKVHQIVVLDESDRHVKVFIPKTEEPINFSELWESFLKDIAFSDHGNVSKQLWGLCQSFVLLLNSFKLSEDGFSTFEVPIVSQKQKNLLAGLYFAVFEEVQQRQVWRGQEIKRLENDLRSEKISEKERVKKEKELQSRKDDQAKEENKYTANFSRKMSAVIKEQEELWVQFFQLEEQINSAGLSPKKIEGLNSKHEKLKSKIIFSRKSLEEKRILLEASLGNPFFFLRLDLENKCSKLKVAKEFSTLFSNTGRNQINSSRGDIFAKCLLELYRLVEISQNQYSSLPNPLLNEFPLVQDWRKAGDDSSNFCYSCGASIASSEKWQIARFVFERPYQRRQSSGSSSQPPSCSSCAVLAFVSPLKVTDESIILKLEPKDNSPTSDFKLKDYLRMLTNKEMHLSSGRYVVLASDRTGGGDLASQKLGSVQYALAKVASIFPVEILSDFKFSLVIQGNSVSLESRHLIFIKGLMSCYRQAIVISGKEINMSLGDTVRYMQQDLPFLAEYSLVKNSGFSSDLKLEQVRELYWRTLKQDLHQQYLHEQGDPMDSDNQLPKRARLYRDVAALTGLTYAFAQFLESTAKGLMKQEDAEREISKLIEKVDDAIAFCYYATLGDEKKTSVQARLYHNPDCDFIYSQTKSLLADLGIADRESKDDNGKLYLQFYADDISRAYQHFATKDYAQEKDWKELTYNLKLSLYTRFPELVRKLKSTSEKN